MEHGFGKYDVYSVCGSLYCYRDTSVLKNRFHLQDAGKLKKLEADLSAIRQADLVLHPINGRFTANHLCRIHRYLLGDIYYFAGHFRREDIRKGSTLFLTHQQISDHLQAILQKLQREPWDDFPEQDFFAKSAYYFAELNYIHPFREGNGRAIREFMRLFFMKNGYSTDWGAVAPQEFLAATEASVYDASVLEPILAACLRKNM